MGKIADMARAEAEQAEAENPDESEDEGEAEAEAEAEAAPEGEPEEGEAPEEGGPSTVQLEHMEQENVRHERTLAKIVGADWALFNPCPHCYGVGFSTVAIEPPRELLPDPRTERCSECNGWGFFRTASRVPTEAERPCAKCGGTGLTPVLAQPSAVAPPPPVAETPPPPVFNFETGKWEAPADANGPSGVPPQVLAPPPPAPVSP